MSQSHTLSSQSFEPPKPKQPSVALERMADALQDETTGFVATDFFEKRGLRKLFLALFKQSVKDLVHVNAHPQSPADVVSSAQWLQTNAGQDCIQFLMPSVSPEIITAQILANPSAVVLALDSADAVSTPLGDETGFELCFSTLETTGATFLDSLEEPEYQGGEEVSPAMDLNGCKA